MKKVTKEQQEKIDDGKFILSLLRFAGSYPGPAEIDGIVRMYRKYINPNASMPNLNCNSCSQSLSAYWARLGDFYNKNKEMFING